MRDGKRFNKDAQTRVIAGLPAIPGIELGRHQMPGTEAGHDERYSG
jgi:hypothetical protein